MNNISKITGQEMRSQPLKGQYYSCEDQRWKSIGWAEWLVRTLFSRFVESVEVACSRRSWEVIEKMETIPDDLHNYIYGSFVDSLCRTNPCSAYAGVISRIVCRILEPSDVIQIKRSPDGKVIQVSDGKDLNCNVPLEGDGKLKFLSTSEEKVATNEHDALWGTENMIGGIKLAVDYPRQDSCMQLYEFDELLAKIEDIRERTSLVFRDPRANKIVAVANRTNHDWKITCIRDLSYDDGEHSNKNEIHLLLAWAVLKYSQRFFGI